MSECSKRLDPLFEEIAEKAIRQQKCKYKSDEWKQLDKELTSLNVRATQIFYHYNPSYKGGKKNT